MTETITAPAGLASLTDLLARAEGFASVLAALEHNRSATVDGAWGSSAALAAAAVARAAVVPVLVVIAHPGDLDAWAADLHSFAGVEPVLLPAWESVPGDAVDDIAGERLRLLGRLDRNDAPRPGADDLSGTAATGAGSDRPGGQPADAGGRC